MNFKFYWYVSKTWNDGILRPDCYILNKESKKPSNIISFLLDDEGLGVKHLQKWVKNGLEQIDKISKKDVIEYDMWGQSLGALISLDKVTVYWGDDEYPEEYWEFEQFKVILSNWYQFLMSERNIEHEMTFSV